MMSSRITTVFFALVALGLVGWFGYRLANATDTYTYRVEFTTLPPSDDELLDWLWSRPGVRQASVTRAGRNLVIEFTMSAHASDPRPDPVEEASRFGYGQLVKYTTTYKNRW